MKGWNSTLPVSKKHLKRSAIKSKPGKKRKKRKPKTERQLLVIACDDIFREIIRIRAGFMSEKSGRGYHPKAHGLQVAHWITRTNKRVRWDFENAYLLTAGEHKWWASVHLEEWRDWVSDHLGQEKFELLRIRARVRGTVTTSSLKLTKIYLGQQLEAVKDQQQPF